MPTSTTPTVIDALVATLQPLITTDTAVYDGPATSANVQKFIAVGWDGSEDGDLTADFTQEWAGIGGYGRDEQVHVTCCAFALVGAGTAKMARDAVYALLALAETALRANVQNNVTNVQWTEVTEGRLHTQPTAAGCSARVVFTVHAYANI